MGKIDNISRKIKPWDIVFAALVLIITVFSAWKAHYGFASDDEPFYLTIPYRMCHGDKLFLHEWNGTLLSALFILPFMKVYLAVMKTTEGMILAFRYIYIAVNTAVAAIAYAKLRRYRFGAAAACSLYLLMIPHNIMALSYNTCGLMNGFLCTAFLISYYEDRKKRDLFIAGVLFAAMVICQPPLIILFALWFAGTMIFSAVKKSRAAMRNAFMFTAGCIVPAVPVAAYLVFFVGVSNIISALPMLWIEKPSSLPRIPRVVFLSRAVFNGFMPDYAVGIGDIDYSVRYFVIIIFAAFILIWIFSAINRKNKEKKWFLLSLSAEMTIALTGVYSLLVHDWYISYLLFPWILHGVTFIILTDKPKNRRILLIAYCMGITHALGFSGSAVYDYVLNMGLVPCCLTVIMLNTEEAIAALSEGKAKRADTFAFWAALPLAFVFLFYARTVHNFGHSEPEDLAFLCRGGVFKGIYETEKNRDRNEIYSADLEALDVTPENNVLVLSASKWMCLELDAPLAQHSAWIIEISDFLIDMLEKYYSYDSDKRPDIVYIPKDEMQKWRVLERDIDVEKWADENGFYCRENDVSYFLERKTE